MMDRAQFEANFAAGISRTELRDALVNYHSVIQPGMSFSVAKSFIKSAGFDDPESFVEWVADLKPKLELSLCETGNVRFTYPKAAEAA